MSCGPASWCPNGAVPAALSDALRQAVWTSDVRLPALIALAAGHMAGADESHTRVAAVAIELVSGAARARGHGPSPASRRERGRAAAALAPLAADACLALAFQTACAKELPAPLQARLCRLLAQAVGHRGQAGGQAFDAVYGPGLGSCAALRERCGRTTGALLKAAACMGAACGGPDARYAPLGDYGLMMGIASHVAADLARASPHAMRGRWGLRAWLRAEPDFVSELGMAGALSYARRLCRRAHQALAMAGVPAESMLARLTDATFERIGAPFEALPAQHAGEPPSACGAVHDVQAPQPEFSAAARSRIQPG